MKRIIFALVSLVMLCSLPSHGREYEPTLVDGRCWLFKDYIFSGYDIYHFPEYEEVVGRIEVVGDTIVDGLSCKRMDYWRDGRFMRIFLAREDLENRRLYSTFISRDFLYPTYDFAHSKGETVNSFDADNNSLYENIDRQYTITADDLIIANSKEWRRLTIDSTFHWVEGIGGLDYFGQLTLFPQSGALASNTFLECRQDGEVIFTREDFDAEPCGVESVVAVEAECAKTYDIMGRSVETTVPGQLYTRNGHKFIAR